MYDSTNNNLNACINESLNAKIQKNLHYIFEPAAAASPAKPLQDLIVLKQNAATEEYRLESSWREA
jgi:hypothetical protein